MASVSSSVNTATTTTTAAATASTSATCLPPPHPPLPSTSASTPAAVAAAASRPGGGVKCVNSGCSDLKSRSAWRLRSGDFAELCDRCASAYEEGGFCETFHLNSMGWRNCESCGKRVHCGCIVSARTFTYLDVDGIECLACTKKNNIFTSDPAWPPAAFCNATFPDRPSDLSVKNWNQLAGSGPVPWRQAPSLFNSSISHSDFHPRTPYEVVRFNTSERISASLVEKVKIENLSDRLMNGSLKLGPRDILGNGNSGNNNGEGLSCSPLKTTQRTSLREDQSPKFGNPLTFQSIDDANGQICQSGIPLRPTFPSPLGKQFHGNLHNGVDSSIDTQIRNVRHQVDVRGKNHLLPRYWPRFTDEELQRISGNTNSIITPLFEKMLSASDAGRIGRLVLPKKCAEAYFPPISKPEGLPLKVQDSKGKEWLFQFRFWPNNNSRMYVMEGVTPCIQSMGLQAGDIVTFSRLEPEGKLVMGFRKASTATTSEQENETNKTPVGLSTNGDARSVDCRPWSKLDRSGKEAFETKSSIKKRNGSSLGSKNKRLRLENEDMMELKITWEEAQGLLRPPHDRVPSIIVIEGYEFEEYEDAPVLGKPAISATDDLGSSCSLAHELTAEQHDELLPSAKAASKRMKTAKQEIDNLETLEGLDTLANLAILGEGEEISSSQTTTKHPRHRPGCSCIVCIQPPSGKGPRHKQPCECVVCQSVNRRFKTLMMKREKKLSEKEAESPVVNVQQKLLPEKLADDEPSPSRDAESGSPNKKTMLSESPDLNRLNSTASASKGQFDLNIQPEREEEFSPRSDSERHPKQQQSSDADGNSVEKAANNVAEGSHQEANKDQIVATTG